MGMTINKAIRDLVYLKGCGIFPFNYGTDAKQLTIATDECIAVAVDIMRKYQMFQLDYEARLKADMVAMLEDLDLQIDESAAYNLEVAKVQRLIRDRIDKLKENTDGINN